MNKIIRLESHQEAQALFGPQDEHLRLVEKSFRAKLSIRDGHLVLSGASLNIKKAAAFVEYALEALRAQGSGIGSADFAALIENFKRPERKKVPSAAALKITCGLGGKQIGPRTAGQREYTEAIQAYDIVFGIGPAGTGKTYLAMASAVEALKKQEVRRIILTRPAIEAGESLGYLPGDMYEKISPYLRPLYDALYDMMEAERIEKYLENGIIEVAPLAYMRGRTLNDAFIILDEAQNCTPEQMKMFLTRLGFDSKAVITGDMTQSDLPEGRPLGLLQARDILAGIEGIKFIYFTGSDVVRHALVQRVIEAYDKANSKK